jgi:multiple sugar transport system permease protein
VVNGKALKHRLRTVGFYALVIIVMLPTVFVFYWMITLSLKPQVEAAGYPPSFFRFTVTFKGYVEVFSKHPFLFYIWNSFVVATGCTLLGLIVGLPAAYSIAHWRQNGLALVVLAARIIPGISYLIPWYILFRNLKMVDTYQALILTHLVVGLPIVIWVMMGFFESQHSELEEAALIDGCDIWRAFLHVAMPLSRSGIVVAGILAFIYSWNNFIFGVVLAGRETRTLPVAVYNVLTFEQIAWGPLAAAALVVTFPVLILTVFIQRQIVTGLAAGAVK